MLVSERQILEEVKGKVRLSRNSLQTQTHLGCSFRKNQERHWVAASVLSRGALLILDNWKHRLHMNGLPCGRAAPSRRVSHPNLRCTLGKFFLKELVPTLFSFTYLHWYLPLQSLYPTRSIFPYLRRKFGNGD